MNDILEQDAPYFDELVDGAVGDLQSALHDAGFEDDANLIEQIMWKLVDHTILKDANNGQ